MDSQKLSVIFVLLGARRIPAQGAGFYGRAWFSFHHIVRCANLTVYDLPFYDYGCSCIFGGTDNQPVDEFDRCCQVHNDCYSEVKKMGCSNKIKRLRARCENETPKCVPLMTEFNWIDCDEKLCNCDVEAALCLRKHYHSYNKEFLQYDQTLCKTPHSSSLQEAVVM